MRHLQLTLVFVLWLCLSITPALAGTVASGGGGLGGGGGAGAVAATVSIYACRTTTAENGVLVATISLAGTTRAQDAAATSTAPYPYFYAVTTGVSGTGATVLVEAYY